MAVYDAATQAKLDELGRLWNQATNDGNTSLAENYHQQANDARNSAGLKAGVDYDTTSGALLSSSPSIQTSKQAKTQEVINNVNQVKEWVNQNKTPVTSQPQTGSSNVNDVIQSLNNWWSSVQNSVTKPTQSTISYQQVLSDLQSQLNPLHQQKLTELEKAQADAEASLKNQMAAAGAYDSSTTDKRMAQLKGNYLSGTADEDAQYEANVAQLANSVYQAGLSRDTSSQQSYDAIIANLAQAYMNGTLDITRMELDDAYRQAQLAQAAQDSYLNNFGQVA